MISEDLLLDGLMATGIIQFGHFVDTGNETAPLRLQFELLPAYPHLLDLAAETVQHRIRDRGLQRLVSDQDSLPLAVCVSQKTAIPLIYNQKDGLVGAYDVGHPAALIANVCTPQTQSALEVIKVCAKRTGLDVITEVFLLGLSAPESPTAQCLIMMNNSLLRQWVQQRWITVDQQAAIEQWLESETATRHPG
jgi:hypothetical protein